MDSTNQILIEKYIEGTLTAQELADFEIKLKTDIGFAKEVAELQDFVTAMQVFGRHTLKSELQTIAQANPLPANIFEGETQKKTAGSEAKVRKISSRRWISVAAVVLIICVPVLLMLNPQKAQPEELFQSYFEAYPNVAAPIVRDVSTKSPLEKAMAFYEQKKYQEAIKNLQGITANAKDQESVSFYVAMSYLANGNTKKAIQHFQKLQKQNLLIYQDQTTWYLALAYLANKEVEKSKTQLNKLTKKDNFYQKKAKKLLESL